MTTDAKRLIRVFLNLSESDKREVAEFIKNFDNSSPTERSTKTFSYLNESRVLGPISSNTCPYCGK
jgi:hypothetical protein